MKVKICGITNVEDALFAEKQGADAIGFIFYKKSERYIDPDSAYEISKKLKPFTSRVGVFVDEDPDLVNKISRVVGLDIIQLHGNEAPDYFKRLDSKIIKVIRVHGESDFKKMDDYPGANFVLDSYDRDFIGGTGKKFDWSLIPNKVRNNIILAGGISPENIIDVIEEVNPYAVDLSSSVEIEPGIKDHDKVKLLFDTLKKYRGEKC